jgi:hypothetical protein
MRHILLYESFSTGHEQFSSGSEHTLYQDPVHSGRLYKRFEGDSLDRFNSIVSLFQQHQDIFPTVYDKGKDWISIEKLDTARAQREYEALSDEIGEDFLEEYALSSEELDPQFMNSTKEIAEIWKRWRTTLVAYAKIYFAYKKEKEDAYVQMGAEAYSKLTDTTLVGRDIHMDQFGYTKEGRLKILDI